MRIRGYDSKGALLRRFVSGRKVLHLGAVGETCSDTAARVRGAETGVHALLTAVAAECVGVDYDEPSVTALLEQGTFDNLMCADVTTLRREDIPLDRIDDVVAGDVIEHLSNPGDLLSSLSAIADDETRLVLTTPNALGLATFVRYLRGRQIEGDDHVCSFNLFSLSNLLERHGWHITEAWTCHQDRAAQAHSSFLFRCGVRLFRLQPRLGGTLFVVASRAAGPSGSR